MIQLSHPYMTTRKTITLTRWTFVGKVMSLLFNMLSRFITAFLPRSKRLLISWLQSALAVIWKAKKIKSLIAHIVSSSICHEVMGPDAMILILWRLSFKPAFSLSSFTLIKGLFTSFLFSAIRMDSSAYLRILIFLPAVLIPACDSSSQNFTWYTLHISYISRVATYSFDILLSQFGSSPVAATRSEKQAHSEGQCRQIVECSLLHRWAQGSLLLAKDPDQLLWKSCIP